MFAVHSIGKGQEIADGIAEEDYERLIPWKRFIDFDVPTRKKIMDFCIGTPTGFIPPEELNFDKLSIEWFLNHSCSGNVGFDRNGDFIAVRRVQAGAELTYDYGLAESNPKFRMSCDCGSPKCRGTITGNDWKRGDFRIRNIQYMLPRLRKLGAGNRKKRVRRKAGADSKPSG